MTQLQEFNRNVGKTYEEIEKLCTAAHDNTKTNYSKINYNWSFFFHLISFKDLQIPFEYPSLSPLGSCL